MSKDYCKTTKTVNTTLDTSPRGFELPSGKGDKKVIMQGYVKVRRKFMFYKKRLMTLLDDGTVIF